MNYRIFLSGYRFSVYDDCIKLLVYSAEQSDYIVEIEGFEKDTPFSPSKNYILLFSFENNVYISLYSSNLSEYILYFCSSGS